MKLSTETINALQNFALINDSIVVHEGNELYTMANSKNVIAIATLKDHFPKRFAIYTLNRFLRSISLFKDPELSFGETAVSISDDNNELEYVYTDESVIGIEKKVPQFSLEYTKFILTKDDIKTILDACSTLQLESVVLEKDKKGNVVLCARDTKQKGGSRFSVKVNVSDVPELLEQGKTVTFDAKLLVFLSNTLKSFPSDFEVRICGKQGVDRAIGTFELITPPQDMAIKYFIAATL